MLRACGEFTRTVDENREPLVTLSFRKAPSLHDCFMIVACRYILISACLSAILSGLVLLITVT